MVKYGELVYKFVQRFITGQIQVGKYTIIYMCWYGILPSINTHTKWQAAYTFECELLMGLMKVSPLSFKCTSVPYIFLMNND